MFRRGSSRAPARKPRPPRPGSAPRRPKIPAYRLAFQDMDFLLREDLRPVRFQLELLKPS